MKNPKLILQNLNLLNGALLSIYLIKIMGWSALFNPIKLMHLIVGAFIIYGLKSWVEIKTNTKDPIKSNKTVYSVFIFGSALFLAGIVFKMMYWPLANFLLIGGVFIACSSFILSFFATDTHNDPNTDIIDNLNHE